MRNPWNKYPVKAPDRITETLAELELAWRAWPNLRLSQLILDIDHAEGDLYYMEDDQLIEKLRERYPKE